MNLSIKKSSPKLTPRKRKLNLKVSRLKNKYKKDFNWVSEKMDIIGIVVAFSLFLLHNQHIDTEIKDLKSYQDSIKFEIKRHQDSLHQDEVRKISSATQMQDSIKAKIIYLSMEKNAPVLFRIEK
jgi:hypothetical protein